MIFGEIPHPVNWLFLVHSLIGAVALIVLPIPLLSKKGGKGHVRAGWIYSTAMIGVGASAFIITPWRALLDPERTLSSQSSAIFLFFISFFTLSSLWFGLIVLKFKRRLGPSRSLSHLLPPVMIIVLGLATQAIGIFTGNVLLILFPFLGHLTAKMHLDYWLNSPSGKMHWWFAHMDGMVIASIATVTAFLVTAVPRMSSSSLAHSPILWIAPGIFGGILLNRWKRAYRLKFPD